MISLMRALEFFQCKLVQNSVLFHMKHGTFFKNIRKNAAADIAWNLFHFDKVRHICRDGTRRHL